MILLFAWLIVQRKYFHLCFENPRPSIRQTTLLGKLDNPHLKNIHRFENHLVYPVAIITPLASV